MEKKLINIEEALNLEKKEVLASYRENINPQLVRMFSLLNFDKDFVRAEGARIYDHEGEEYLDFLGGYGSLNFGHNPEEISAAVRMVEQMPNLLQAAPGRMEAAAAHNLVKVCPGNLSRVFFANSGAEAIEAALKLARAASEKEKLLYCSGSFHGKTMGALSLTGRDKYRQPFTPLVPEMEMVPYGDPGALEFKLESEEVAAFFLEPIQGEGGIIIPPPGYLQEVRQLCDRYGVLMILDEIQSGMGRTGENFACEREGVVPDILCAAKSLGGGIVPAGACVSKKEIWDRAYGSLDKALLHTSTFGGNTRTSAAVLESTRLLEEWGLASMAREKGEYLLAGLKEITPGYELVKEVRGCGLMIGVEFEQEEKGLLDRLSGGKVSKYVREYLGAMVAGLLLNEYNILTAYTLNNPRVIRLEPPLVVKQKELDRLLEAFDDIFSSRDSLLDFAFSSARNALGGLFGN
ncbi:MAG: aspartate aminotransferase family protein [Bacillota bacterium]